MLQVLLPARVVP